jgi:DNA-binding MarR family transcriptional regulator
MMDKRLFFLINKARHRMFKYAEAQSEARLGTSVTQTAALMFIGKNEGCLQKDLAKILGLNHSAVTGLVGRMIKNGLINRQTCDDDARASRLYLTELGQTKAPQIKPLMQEFNEKLTKGFSEDEIDVVLRFLNNIVDDFRE